MNKPTPGPWSTGKRAPYFKIQGDCVVTAGNDEDGYFPIADLRGTAAVEEQRANAALIVAAVNACFAVNPDNSLAVAEALPALVQDMKYLLRIIEAFHVEIRGDERIPKGFCQGKIFVEWPEGIRTALAKLEATP